MNEWKATVAQDTEWYLRYVEKHSDLKDGEILPYNPKFGITEREYYEMVECLSSPSFKKVAEDEFVIVKEGSVYRIDSANIIRDFINLRLDEESMVLEGYFGRIDQCDTVISREAPIGTWTGYSWSEEEGDVQNGRLITFFLGFFDGTSRGLIGFKLRIIKDGVLVAGCDWKIFFESGV
ncbi:MAG: hypothetical protein JSV33_15005 [bacterium]|nr:MAG: hypothetical protein JSV33_15005 [bacterium]